MRSAFARLINHFLSVCIRFCQNFLVTLLRFGQFLLDLFGVDLALFDLAPALFKKSKDRFVSEPLQKERNNAEANDLRQKQLPVPAEHMSCFTHNVADASAGGGKYRYHKIKLVHAFRRIYPPATKLFIGQKVERVEHDRLGQRDGENSVHEHLRERARIATDRAGNSQA